MRYFIVGYAFMSKNMALTFGNLADSVVKPLSQADWIEYVKYSPDTKWRDGDGDPFIVSLSEVQKDVCEAFKSESTI